MPSYNPLSNHGKNALATEGYQSWAAMNRRCYDESFIVYRDYGGRGLTVCARWRDSFWNFIEDLGVRPEGAMLERKDNAKGYSPENCLWDADISTQMVNRRKFKKNTTGVKGVTVRRRKATHKLHYAASIRRNNVLTHLYEGPDFLKAVSARKSAENQERKQA